MPRFCKSLLIDSKFPFERFYEAFHFCDTEELAKESVRDAAVKVLEGNVIANRNHPSIFLWSIGWFMEIQASTEI